MGVTVTGLDEVLHDLQSAHDRVADEGSTVVGQGCNNIKRQAARIVRAASHRGYLPHYPRSIDYDVTTAGTVITGEVGPNRAKLQGGLGRLIELGSANNAPIPHLSPALDAEEPGFARYTEEMGARALEGGSVTEPVKDPGP
jgi:hypothetical protein